VRRNSKQQANSAEALAARLPDELRSFDAWHYTDNGMPTGIQDYLAALAAQVAPHEPIPVMNAAGLSAADWYRARLTAGAGYAISSALSTSPGSK
jgi:hypothetical protein